MAQDNSFCFFESLPCRKWQLITCKNKQVGDRPAVSRSLRPTKAQDLSREVCKPAAGERPPIKRL